MSMKVCSYLLLGWLLVEANLGLCWIYLEEEYTSIIELKWQFYRLTFYNMRVKLLFKLLYFLVKHY